MKKAAGILLFVPGAICLSWFMTGLIGTIAIGATCDGPLVWWTVASAAATGAGAWLLGGQ